MKWYLDEEGILRLSDAEPVDSDGNPVSETWENLDDVPSPGIGEVLTIEFEDFKTWFKPLDNHLSKNGPLGGKAFETYGDELAFVKKADPDTVWSVVMGDGFEEDDDEDYWWITPGFHFVNLNSYVVCAVKTTREDIQIRY